jgi:fumarate hydratase subunit alpha
MRVIPSNQITATVSALCIKANLSLRKDVLARLQAAFRRETKPRARKILDAIIKNAGIAEKERLAICQDTGLPCVFVELGQDVKVEGDLKQAIQKGIAEGYKKGFFRNSIVADPLTRGVAGYTPAIIHIDIVKGKKIKLTVMPKGFGCENKTKLKMFNPTAKLEEIKGFIVEAVRSAGPDACPPYVVGVGIGGSADYSCLLAKKALLRRVTSVAKKYGVTRSQGHKVTSYTSELEEELLGEINKLGIGPMGLGGRTTALGVNVEVFPTHIAGLPVCVNISCHALRSATKTL